MIAAIHQPNFLPWIGYFYKMSKADVFIILDDVQFSKNSYINRNKIKTPNGAIWLTLPVITSGKFGQKINEVEIKEFNKSRRKILDTIKMNYSRAEYFKNYFPELEEIFSQDYNSLSDLNINLILWIAQKLQITPVIKFSSSLPLLEAEGTLRLINICKEIGADTYLSGFGGNNYQEEKLFNDNNIYLKTYDFKHPVYKQLWGNFEYNLSTIDLILNCGENSRNIIIGQS